MKVIQFVALLTPLWLCSAAAHAVTIDTVRIGNPGNPNDTRYISPPLPNGAGGVDYVYNIGKTEVTNAQYVEFLNAVAKSDLYGLYNPEMGSSTWGGIVRSGVAGNYTYAVKPAALGGAYTHGGKPVNLVSSGDAMRFANWLHNGQPTGPQDATTTEDGAYTLNGANTDDTLPLVVRNPGARWFLPTEDEWYKAAYHKNDGATGNYWDYPTGTNAVPNNNLPSADTGNSANFYQGTNTTHDQVYPLTDAGAYTLSLSPYGTLDQGGSMNEWNETSNGGAGRGLRGGSFGETDIFMHAQFWNGGSPTIEPLNQGFRVASIPEPGTMALASLGAATFLLAYWRRR